MEPSTENRAAGGGKRGKVLIGIAVLAAAAAVAAAIFLQSKPLFGVENNPRVTSISADMGQGGESYSCEIPEEEIPDELNDALISLFLDAEMRNRLLPRPEGYSIEDGSVYLSIKVSLDDAENLSMFVNLSNRPDFSSAQFRDTHYRIVDEQALYQAVYGLLSDVLPAYAVQW